jgi:hypothetical protein
MHGYRLAAIAWLAATACGDAGRPAPPPAWSHAPDAPPRRIAGHLYGGAEPLAGRLSLRLDAPDPSAWPGRDVDAGADGRFDFGLLPAGRYTIVATAPGRISRVVEVDTRDGAHAGLEIYAYPCAGEPWTVQHQGAPVAGAVVEVGGIAVATSDASGRVAVCQRHGWRAVVRAPGHGVEALANHAALHERVVELAAAAAVTGTAVAHDGTPVAGAAVRPLVAIQQHHDDDQPWFLDPPSLATTDAHGRFTLPALAVTRPDRRNLRMRGEPAPPARSLPIAYRFAVSTSTSRWEPAHAARPGDPPLRLILDSASRIGPPPDAPTVVARIAGQVRLAGAPFVDAEVFQEAARRDRPGPGASTTQTRRDGSFDLALVGHDLFERADASGAIDVELIVRHDDSPAIARRLVRIRRGEHLAGLVIDIAGAGTIEGVVLQHDGTPAPPRTVAVIERASGVAYNLGTRAGGHFRARVELGQTYDVVAGHSPDAQAVVSLTAAAPDAAVRLVLPPPTAGKPPPPPALHR